MNGTTDFIMLIIVLVLCFSMGRSFEKHSIKTILIKSCEETPWVDDRTRDLCPKMVDLQMSGATLMVTK